jgi:hypothetical protein
MRTGYQELRAEGRIWFYSVLSPHASVLVEEL